MWILVDIAKALGGHSQTMLDHQGLERQMVIHLCSVYNENMIYAGY